MTDVKMTIAKNITALRQSYKMTQIELAEKLNYSDKAVSKWERGESIPDVIVLKSIADLFGVSLDYLVETDHDAVEAQPAVMVENNGYQQRNRRVTTTLSVILVWFIAILCYVVMDLCIPATVFKWIPFAYAVPISVIVWLVFNSTWFNRRHNYGIISLLMWSGLVCLFLTLLAAGYLVWKFFLLGIPGQIAILLWSRFQRKGNN